MAPAQTQTLAWEGAALTAEASEEELVWATHLPGAGVVLRSESQAREGSREGLQPRVDTPPRREGQWTIQGNPWLARQAQQLSPPAGRTTHSLTGDIPTDLHPLGAENPVMHSFT